MCRNAINFPYNPGHVTLWSLEVVPVLYAKLFRTLFFDGYPIIYDIQWLQHECKKMVGDQMTKVLLI